MTFLAAEGSPEQYIVRLRKDDEKRMDLSGVRRAGRRRGRHPGRAARPPGGVQLVTEPGKLQTPGGGLRLPVLRRRRPHHRDLLATSRSGSTARSRRGRRSRSGSRTR